MLGFQHYLLTLGITVLIPSMIVPQMGGGDVRMFTIFYINIFMVRLLCWNLAHITNLFF